MASIASDSEQQNLQRSFTSPDAVRCHDEASPSSKGSTDGVIYISDDEESDLENEDDVEDHVHDNSQSYCTTPTAASDADYFESIGTKRSVTESHATIHTSTIPVPSPARTGDVRILSHKSSVDSPTDLESNQRAPQSTMWPPTRDTTADADVGRDASPLVLESQSCSNASDEQQRVTNIVAGTSKPRMTIDDAPSDEEFYHSQTDAVARSVHTHSPLAAHRESIAQSPLRDSEVCTGASTDDAGDRSSSPTVRPPPRSRQDQGASYDRSSTSEAEAEFSVTESGSLLTAGAFPPHQETISRRRNRRGTSRTYSTIQDKISGADTENSDCEDSRTAPEPMHDEEYCPPPEGEVYDSTDDSEDEEQPRRKRQRVSRSAAAWSSHQRRSASSARTIGGRPTSVHRIESPTSSHAQPLPAESTSFARFEEWALRGVSLKRITESDKTTFQLQFEWTPDLNLPRHNKPTLCNEKGRSRSETSKSAIRSSGNKWTKEEEEIVVSMRRGRRSWAEIHDALPDRSLGSIQVRYSTKLNKQIGEVGQQAS